MEEVKEKIDRGYAWVNEEWIKPPNKNKGCHCKSKLKYKNCCLIRDHKAMKDLYARATGKVKDTPESKAKSDTLDLRGI
jgi:hypothetical protein